MRAIETNIWWPDDDLRPSGAHVAFFLPFPRHNVRQRAATRGAFGFAASF